MPRELCATNTALPWRAIGVTPISNRALAANSACPTHSGFPWHRYSENERWALGTESAGGPSPPTTEASPELQEPLVPLPLTLAVDPARAALGEQLFQDVRPCGQNRVACATCHQLALGRADGHPQALGANGTPLLRNTPRFST